MFKSQIKSLKTLIDTNYFKSAILIVVFLFTFILRAHNYDKIPEFGHLEEMMFAWAGLHLIETGVPVSWSTLDYPKSATIYTGIIGYGGNEPFVSVDLRKPWLDQPPLFSLLVGYFAHWYGADRTEIVPSSYIRIPSIFLGFITSIFLFLIARKISGFWVGLLAVMIYGTVPLFVFASRFALPENLIACFYMIIIYLLFKFEEVKKYLYLLPIPLMIGIAGLSKPTGFFMLPVVLFFLFRNRYYKTSAAIALSVIPFIAAFFWYGLSYNQEIFWAINANQSFRPVGFASIAWFFVSPAYDILFYNDTWYILCLLSAAFFLFKDWVFDKEDKEGFMRKYVSFFFLYWLIVVMFSGGEGDLLPWYRFPAFPLLALLGTWGIILLYKRANFVSSVIAISFLMGNRHFLQNAFRPNILPTAFRVIFTSMIAPSLLNMVYPHKLLQILSRGMIIVAFVVGMYWNVVLVYQGFEGKCESLSCPIGPSTKLSELKLPFIWRFIQLPARDK